MKHPNQQLPVTFISINYFMAALGAKKLIGDKQHDVLSERLPCVRVDKVPFSTHGAGRAAKVGALARLARLKCHRTKTFRPRSHIRPSWSVFSRPSSSDVSVIHTLLAGFFFSSRRSKQKPRHLAPGAGGVFELELKRSAQP